MFIFVDLFYGQNRLKHIHAYFIQHEQWTLRRGFRLYQTNCACTCHSENDINLRFCVTWSISTWLFEYWREIMRFLCRWLLGWNWKNYVKLIFFCEKKLKKNWSVLKNHTLPAKIIWLCGRFVLLYQTINHLTRFIQLRQIIFEHIFTFELIQKCTTLPQFVVLVENTLE